MDVGYLVAGDLAVDPALLDAACRRSLDVSSLTLFDSECTLMYVFYSSKRRFTYMAVKMDGKRYLKTAEAAQTADVNVQTIRRWIERGHVTARQMSTGRWLVEERSCSHTFGERQGRWFAAECGQGID